MPFEHGIWNIYRCFVTFELARMPVTIPTYILNVQIIG